MMSGCGPLYFSPEFTSRSPDSKSEVRVMRNLKDQPADYKFRIEVSSDKGTRIVFKDDLESSLGLIEAHWSAGGEQMGLLVCNLIGPPVWVNYDVAHDQMLSPMAMQPIIVKQLKLKYSLADGTDAISWACSKQGMSAYRELNKMGALK
jgi:hypothetical protein